MRRRPWGWLVLAALTTSGMAKAGGPPDAERLKIAAEEFDAGRRAFKVKDFEGAAVHFENADRDAPSPEALQSAMRARKEGGQMARAATLGAWGLARYPNDKTFGDYARTLVADAEKSLHKVSISCMPDCTVIVDNKVMPFPESASAVVYLDPGAHTVVAGWSNNRHRNADVTAVAGGSNRLNLAAGSAEKTPSSDGSTPREPVSGSTEPQADRGPENEKKSGLPPVVFYAGIGLTAVLGGITTWSGIDTVNNPGVDTVKAACDAKKPECSSLTDLGQSHERRTNILVAATSVVGVTTAVIGLFFTSWGEEPPQTAKKDKYILPVVGVNDGVTIGAVGRF